MRSKVILIRGFWNLAPEITVASFERINADQVGLMTVLRYPQYMPEPLDNFHIDPVIDFFNGDILKHLQDEGNEHCLLSQYGEIATETGGLNSIRVVEGDILRTDWFYEAVKTYHKSAGQCVCVCNLEYWHKDHHIVADIDGIKFFKREEVIERLACCTLG